jgi:catechol 2,3-dioxygenase-like lactoylglutathione lyase family enzyme
MISGAHVILYSADAEADRAFFRDVLKLRGVDAGEGWLPGGGTLGVYQPRHARPRPDATA